MTAAFRIPPQHLLVATDLSPRSGLALRRAAAIATEHDAAITAVHAVAPSVHPERADYARSRLHALANEHAPTVVVNTLVRVGKPKVVIADEVCNCGADLLLVRTSPPAPEDRRHPARASHEAGAVMRYPGPRRSEPGHRQLPHRPVDRRNIHGAPRGHGRRSGTRGRHGIGADHCQPTPVAPCRIDARAAP